MDLLLQQKGAKENCASSWWWNWAICSPTGTVSCGCCPTTELHSLNHRRLGEHIIFISLDHNVLGAILTDEEVVFLGSNIRGHGNIGGTCLERETYSKRIVFTKSSISSVRTQVNVSAAYRCPGSRSLYPCIREEEHQLYLLSGSGYLWCLWVMSDLSASIWVSSFGKPHSIGQPDATLYATHHLW